MKKAVNFLKQHKYLLGILSLGLILRLIGLAHGYPYILNIDEPALVRSAMGIRFSIWIDHFDWPHLNFYLHYIFYEIFIKARAVLQMLNLRSQIEAVVPILWDDPFIFYLLSRFLNSVFVVLAGVPLYLCARSFFAKKYALVGLLVFILIPFSLSISRYALQEPAQLFFLAWALYFSIKAAKRTDLKNFIYLGLFIGLAIGVKYNAALFGFLPIFLYLINSKFEKKEFFSFALKMFLAGFVSLLIFIATTFSLIKYWDIFWSDEPGRGLLWQLFENISPLTFKEFWPKLLENLISFRLDLSPGIFLLLTLTIILGTYMFFKLNNSSVQEAAKYPIKASFVFICFFCFYFIYTSRYEKSGGHYMMPIYIFIPVLVAEFFYLLDFLVSAYHMGFLKKLFIIGVFLLILPTISYNVLKFVKPNYYVEAIKYVKQSFSESGADIYAKGEEIRNINAINNLGFKIYEDDSKIELKDVVISEETINREGLEVVESFENSDNPNKFVKIYVKNQ